MVVAVLFEEHWKTGRIYRYIAGLFDHETATQAYLDGLEDDRRHGMELKILSSSSFPVLAMEDERGFTFFADEAAAEDDLRQRSTPRNPQADWVYTNRYLINEPFSGAFGRDEMGGLRHWHIEASHLDLIEREGLRALWMPR